METIFQSTGNEYSCRGAKNGQEVLDLIDTNGNPDLLILDLWMPVKDGFDVLAEISSDKAKYNFPVLVVTGLAEQSKIRAAYQAGADDVIIKPFAADDIIMRAGKLITSHFGQKDMRESIQTLNNINWELQYGALIMLCKMVEEKDGHAASHVDRVGEMSYTMAQRMGLTEEMCTTIRYAAKIHDIGKMTIDDRILQKPNKLTDEEYEIVKSHTIKGAEIIETVKHNILFRSAHDIILAHHEHFDGKGYPYGLKGEDIPIAARITAVADVYDALTHQRSYKDAWPPEEAEQYISYHSGSQFDPHVTQFFLSSASVR